MGIVAPPRVIRGSEGGAQPRAGAVEDVEAVRGARRGEAVASLVVALGGEVEGALPALPWRLPVARAAVHTVRAAVVGVEAALGQLDPQNVAGVGAAGLDQVAGEGGLGVRTRVRATVLVTTLRPAVLY